MTLNEKINELLRSHPEGGEGFFNALDYLVRSDIDILEKFLHSAINDYCNHPLIMSGNFGRAIINNFGSKLYREFDHIVLANGNLRGDDEAELYLVNRRNFSREDFVFLDDSFYSGRTRDKLDAALKLVHSSFAIVKTYVIYDGSPERTPNVHGMFRYHK